MIPGDSKSKLEIMGMAHDLNNILATIMGYAEMIQEDLPDNSPLTDNTGNIISAVTRAKSITNQILAYDGIPGLNKLPVNINEILKETAGYVLSILPAEIRLDLDIPGTPVPVFAEPTQLFRVFLNLMTNGVRSMERKGGILYLGVRIAERDLAKSLIMREIYADDYVVITFKDTGCGMDDKMIRKIFKPFFTTKETRKGTGLGLSVVREIVTDLAGEVRVSSKLNEGSVFDIYLPVYK
jgi:signal transduction histidine kinase